MLKQFFSPSLTSYVGTSHFWTPNRIYNQIRPEVCPKASKVTIRNLRSVPEAPKILSRHLRIMPEASKIPIGYLSSSSEASKHPIRYVGSEPEVSKVPSSCFRSVTEEKKIQFRGLKNVSEASKVPVRNLSSKSEAPKIWIFYLRGVESSKQFSQRRQNFRSVFTDSVFIEAFVQVLRRWCACRDLSTGFV